MVYGTQKKKSKLCFLSDNSNGPEMNVFARCSEKVPVSRIRTLLVRCVLERLDPCANNGGSRFEIRPFGTNRAVSEVRWMREYQDFVAHCKLAP